MSIEIRTQARHVWAGTELWVKLPSSEACMAMGLAQKLARLVVLPTRAEVLEVFDGKAERGGRAFLTHGEAGLIHQDDGSFLAHSAVEDSEREKWWQAVGASA